MRYSQELVQQVPIEDVHARLDGSPLGPLDGLLDEVATLLTPGTDATAAIRMLTDGLRDIRAQSSRLAWSSVIVPAARRHPISRFIYQCPLTCHARMRPRGYPGDADLLDLIYRHPSAEPKLCNATPLGLRIFDVTGAVPACEAVRERRRFVARRIDQIALQTQLPDILAVACGHLREAELSGAFHAGAIGSWTALDQDSASLAGAQDYGAQVRPVNATVRDILTGKHEPRDFDFIYAAGLYDYLQPATAARLTARLFTGLKSGGTLLIANFLDGIWEAPYMEAFMDWHLAYRDEAEIRAFLAEVPTMEIASTSYRADASRCIGYLEVRRQ